MKILVQHLLVSLLILTLHFSSTAQSIIYTMPAETKLHEGTWLSWPHDFTYGAGYASKYEAAWVAMTRALTGGENVHIVAYNETEKTRIISLLTDSNIALDNVDFYIIETDDYWIRDNGPIFTYDAGNNLKILDWYFNGWGNDTPYLIDDQLPNEIGIATGMGSIDLSAMELEGGAMEVDGSGSALATRSSIQGDGRNPDLTEAEIETYLHDNLGITNMIWLDGQYGANWDITDIHIDGFAKFLNDSTIITMDSLDLRYWDISAADISTLYHSKNAAGIPYKFVFLPLTANKVITTWGQNVGYKSSYTNYYVGNKTVLATTFNDPNDAAMISQLQSIYPDKDIAGIDSRNILSWGGMVHCVTQQQPATLVNSIQSMGAELPPLQIFPNPVSATSTISFHLNSATEISIKIYDVMGNEVTVLYEGNMSSENHSFQFNAKSLSTGIYQCILRTPLGITTKKMIVAK